MYVMTAAALAAALSPAASLTEPSRSAVVGEPSPIAVSDGDHHKRKAATPSRGGRADDDDDDDKAIVVTGEARPVADILGGVSVLDGDEILHDMKPTLGDLLTDMPGVSASSFGPTASRPILRGEQGERAPVLVDGISSLDLSASDPDHAVTINPITALRIEVLHGPGALLYSPSAIGGVVNVIDTRIPRTLPTEVTGDVLLNYGTAASERSGNAGVDVPLGGHFVAHGDGAFSKYDDLHIGGYVLSQ